VALNGNPVPKHGAPGRHFALLMALIFVLMLVMIFFVRNKTSTSPNVNRPATQRRLP